MKKIFLSTGLMSFIFLAKAQLTVTFTADTTLGCGPLCVNFQNTTPNSVSCFWQFGDGGNSTQCNPSYCYLIPGTYNVTLTVTDVNNSTGSYTANNYITAYPNPVANFTFSVSGLCVYLTDNSSGAAAYTWNFGDGSPLNYTQNPTHCYPWDGIYQVCLLVYTPDGCADSICQWVPISTNGIPENDLSSLVIVPSVSSGDFILDLGNGFSGEARIDLMDITGRRIIIKDISEPRSVLDLSGISCGTYLVRILSGEASAVRKIVITR